MLIHIIKLPDGTELRSGAGTQNAVMAVKCTESVNVRQELNPGSAFANMIEATILTPGGGVVVNAGDEVTVYKVDETGNRTQYGIFTLEKPTRPTANTLKLTGYDRMLRLDKDLTEWVNSLNGWPYRLTAFAEMVCNVCGIGYTPREVPNGDFPVHQFSKSNMTGRQIMRWLGEICCRFCRITADGRLEFAWYEPSGKVIAPTGDGYYFAGSLTYGDYMVMPVDGVQLCLAEGKNGALWPDKDGDNPYIITGNYILLARVTEDLLPYLQVMERELAKMTYVPLQVSVPATLEIRAGHTVTVLDKNGKELRGLVMTKTTSGQRDTLKCTGSYRRDSADAANNKTMDQIAQEKADEAEKKATKALSEYAEAVSGDIEKLQQQIDGQIQTWFYDYKPTADNFPASEWSTEALKNEHLGDLFYVVDNDELGGFAYRWALVNGIYQWVIVEDAAVSQALALASEAKDTADSKRRVFVSTPYPPYDVGDLWTQGGTGGLMRCHTAKASGSYLVTDWEPATNYIDSQTAGGIAQGKADAALSDAKTYADKAAANAVNAQTQADIFNRLTDNGKIQGIYAQNGKWYINAELAQIVNLVAEVLRSTSGNSTLSISGAELTMQYGGRETVNINNEHGNSATIGLTTYSAGGALESAAFLNSRQFELGGPGIGDRLYIGVDADTRSPYMIFPGPQEPIRTLFWQYSEELGCEVLCGSY